jgi:hypothetical protein
MSGIVRWSCMPVTQANTARPTRESEQHAQEADHGHLGGGDIQHGAGPQAEGEHGGVLAGTLVDADAGGIEGDEDRQEEHHRLDDAQDSEEVLERRPDSADRGGDALHRSNAGLHEDGAHESVVADARPGRPVDPTQGDTGAPTRAAGQAPMPQGPDPGPPPDPGVHASPHRDRVHLAYGRRQGRTVAKVPNSRAHRVRGQRPATPGWSRGSGCPGAV